MNITVTGEFVTWDWYHVTAGTAADTYGRGGAIAPIVDLNKDILFENNGDEQCFSIEIIDLPPRQYLAKYPALCRHCFKLLHVLPVHYCIATHYWP